MRDFLGKDAGFVLRFLIYRKMTEQIKFQRRMEGGIFLKKGFVILLAAVLMVLPGCREKEKPVEHTEDEIVQMPVEEEKKEEKKKPETEKKETEYKVKISGKLSDFQFAVNDKVWTLPVKAELLEQDGWIYTADKGEEELEAESYVEGKQLTKGKQVLTVDFVNLDTEKKNIKECFVGGITFEQKKDGPTYQLPGNLITGKAVLNDVLKKYGTPDDEYEEKEDIYVTYKYGLYKEAELVFKLEDEILYKVSLKNYREPKNKSEVISEDEPQEAAQYQPPKSLSQKPEDYIASYDNQLYRIPAPVSQFLKNGWTIQEDGSESYVKAGRHGYVTLEKQGQTLYAVVKNYAKQTVKAENTFLTNISGDFEVIKVPITIGNDITLGMAEEELKTRLEGSTYETEEKEEGIAYSLYSDETKKNFIRILVDKELHLIREIDMSNSPENLNGDLKGGENTQDGSVLIDENTLSEEE